MTFERTKYDVVFRPLAEGKSDKRALPGELSVCENAGFSKGGRIDKRRGYSLVPVQTAVGGDAIDPDNVFHAAAVVDEELLVFGHDVLYGVIDRLGGLGGTALSSRGPYPRGNVDVIPIATAPLSEI